jgi:molybdopterin-synthase adenylyltransferase
MRIKAGAHTRTIAEPPTMELDITTPVYRARPVQVIDHDNGVILKRGALETHVQGERALDIVRIVLETAHAGATKDQLLQPFPPIEQPAVDYLIDQLIQRRILDQSEHPLEETPESIFYWELDQDEREVKARLRQAKIAIVGVNELSLELSRSLRRSGFEPCDIIDYPLLRNLRLFNDDGTTTAEWSEDSPLALDEWQKDASHESIDCIVATCDHGGLHWLRHWNQFCVANGLRFYPVALQNLIGHIGPYVVPGETACFECLRARQNSNLARPEEERAVEMLAFDTQSVVSFHPAMPGAVAHIAAMQLVKVFGQTLPFSPESSFIEVNLLVPKLVTRRVLRIPNCSVCQTLLANAAVNTEKNKGFMPGNRR